MLYQNNTYSNIFYSRKEDAYIIDAVHEKHISPESIAYLPPLINRSSISIRLRYRRLLKEGIVEEYKSTQWSLEMDQKLLHMTYRRNYNMEKKLCKSFPGKSLEEIVQRKNFLMYHAHCEQHNQDTSSSKDDNILDSLGTFRISKFRKHVLTKIQQITPSANKCLIARKRCKTYCKSYFTKVGRTKSYRRSPTFYLHSRFSRSSAVLLSRQLKYLKADIPSFISKYIESPEETRQSICSNPGMDSFICDSVKHHLVHILSKGSFATDETFKEPELPLPTSISNNDESENHYHPPNASTLILARSLTLHREYLLDQSNGSWDIRHDSIQQSSNQTRRNGENSDDQPCFEGQSVSTHFQNSPEQSRLWLQQRLEALLLWPVLLGLINPPLTLQHAKEEVLRESDSQGLKMTDDDVKKIPRKKNGKLPKKELKRIRAQCMLKTFYGRCFSKNNEERKIEEECPKRIYRRRPKQKNALGNQTDRCTRGARNSLIKKEIKKEMEFGENEEKITNMDLLLL
jgi:hypothetical protein